MSLDQQQQETLKRLQRFSKFTDSNIRIPFTRFRVGTDAIIGLIPGVGDLTGFLISFYVLFSAQKLGVNWQLKLRMLFNMLIDFVIGSIPFFGDIFDAYFKANSRNTKLLKRYIENAK